MPPDLMKRIPLAGVVIACGLLGMMAKTEKIGELKRPTLKLGNVPAASTYAPSLQVRDPFGLPSSGNSAKEIRKVASDTGEALIEGLFWNPPTSLVSIAGHLLREGESIDKIRVIQILQDKVLYEQDGEGKEFQMEPESAP